MKPQTPSAFARNRCATSQAPIAFAGRGDAIQYADSAFSPANGSMTVRRHFRIVQLTGTG